MSDGIAMNIGHALALGRAAEAMLRALGGTEVLVRVPAGAGVSTEGLRLGFTTRPTEDIAVSPVVRTAAKDASAQTRTEFLVAASIMDRIAEDHQYASASDLFSVSLGIVCQGKLFRIAGVRAELFAGAPYLYRVTISE